MGLKDVSWYICMVLCILLGCYVEAGISKIAYKKSIQGKGKLYNKIKMDLVNTTKPTASTTITTGTVTEFDTTTGSTSPVEEKIQLEQDFLSTTPMNIKDIPLSSSLAVESTTELYQTSTTTDTSTNTTTSNSTSQEIIPCTCGIFLSSQFVKDSQDPPTSEPAISNTIDRNFPCNPIGQKHCQTKCLEQIVQHLPNSANILCASLDHDIHKERAYLFIKNCSNNWYNTNLAAGREYCCRNGRPYKCSIK